jgi:hypothetical protein
VPATKRFLPTKSQAKPRTLPLAFLWLMLGAFLVAIQCQAAASRSLEQDFTNPPAAARPWVYWMWMDGNLTREGITADLEAMRRVGIGGVIIMETNVGIPRGPVKFMSPEWRGLFKHVVREAERLGIQVTLNAGPGWTGSGGPWVKPEQSMQHIVGSSLEATGPTHLDQVLPKPARRPAFFGDGALPPELEKAKNEFYRDVVVLAYPTPPVSGKIEDLDDKALYVRAPYSSAPNVRPWFPSRATYPPTPSGLAIDPAQTLDITRHLQADGRLVWDVPNGKWTILRLGRTSTGANTRPAPTPGLGLECDKLDKAALDAHFENFVGVLLRELGGRKGTPESGWNFLHIDSWEMGAQNWTANFREEFKRRRGYDLLRYLPAITGQVVESSEFSERFLWDLRQTVNELILENHAKHLKALGHHNGFGLSIEPYDMTPCADVSLGSIADVPMCEFWLYGFNTCYSVIEAASSAHTCGRPIVAAEAFTSTDAERWQACPSTMKSLGDWAFCAGVNRIVFHRYQHQPWLDLVPGMTMGPYGVHWERTQTWWEMSSAYHQYLARCQAMLRRGQPVAEVCYLVAEGAPHVFRPPASATIGNPPARLGYNFDGCAPEICLESMQARNGRITFPGGMNYQVLVLPERDTMTVPMLKKVKSLVQAGAVVIGPPPQKSPGLSDYPRCDSEIQTLARELWAAEERDQSAAVDLRTIVRRGHVIWSDPGPAGRAAEEAALKHAKWMWHNEGNPAAQAPVAKRYFRRVLRIDSNQALESAIAFATADNSFELTINGTKVLDGSNYHEVDSGAVTSHLKPGDNLIALTAENAGEKPNPAGVICAIRLKFKNGESQELVSDRTWSSATQATAGWDKITGSEPGWTNALELGDFDMAPWNLRPKSLEQPQYGDFGQVASVLQQLGILPDFETKQSDGSKSSQQGSVPLRYIHRADGNIDIYFVSNPNSAPLDVECTFRVSGKPPELWDPLTTETRPLPVFTEREGRTSVPMRFGPVQSFFVIFREHARAGSKEILAGDASKNFPEAHSVAEIPGPWKVSFDPKRGGPESVVFENLQDWSTRPEDGIKFYSGTAVYRTRFEFNRTDPKMPRVYLEFSDVKNMARVHVNGHEAGVIWCQPWRIEITKLVQAGGNELEVEVANLWPNRLIGDERFAPDAEYGRGGNLSRFPDWLLKHQPRPVSERLTFATWKHFNKDSPLLPSGLLGPVRIFVSTGW